MKSPRLLRTILGSVIAVLILAVVAYTAYWFVMAERLRTGLENWAVARRAEGYEIAWRRATVAGFPLEFRMVLDGAALARGNPAAYRVAAPTIWGVAQPWDLSRWHVEAPQGATGMAQGLEGALVARSLVGNVTLGADATRFDLAAMNLAGAGAQAGEIDADVMLPRQPPRSHRDLGLAAAIQLFHLTLPKPVKPLGNVIEDFALDVHIMGGLPPGDWREALAAWRDAGGTIEVSRATLQWGALMLETNGTLALDDAMQPMAAMTASIINHDALIDAAAAAGVLPAKNMELVKLVLDLIARRGADGRMRLTAPVTVQNGKLAIGNAKIGKVPRIEWR